MKRNAAAPGNGVDLKRMREDFTKIAVQAAKQAIYSAAVNEVMTKVGGKIEDIQIKSRVSAAIKALHDCACTRILVIADKIRVYRGNMTEVEQSYTKVEPPEDRYWGFNLGDYVKVKGTFEEFKSMQKATIGWDRSLKSIYGKTGVVIFRMSGYDNAIRVLFPQVGAKLMLYAEVLENATEPDDVKESGDQNPEALVSKWKVGDIVTVNANQLMITLIGVKSLLTGKRVQIVGFAGKDPVVTLNGEAAYAIKTSLLLSASDKTPIENRVGNHPKGFVVGEKVMMSKNMKKLIDNQKGKAEWDVKMSFLRGKTVTILKIQNNGTVNVQGKNEHSWLVNTDSVMKTGVEEPDKEEDLPFRTGDVIKLKIPTNIRSILEKHNISPTFIECMRLVGVVGPIDNTYTPFIRFHNKTSVRFDHNLLCVPTDEEKEKYLAVQKKLDNLAFDFDVYLDVGPSNFVREVLQDAGKDEDIISALTKPSKLKGFLPNNKVLIEYEDGSKYTLNKKYLTLPQRLYLEKWEEGLDLSVSQHIVADIQEAILAKVNEEASARKGLFKSINTSSGNPQSIHISVYPGIAVGLREVVEYLERAKKWKTEIICENQFMIQNDSGEAKVTISFSEKKFGDGETVTERIACGQKRSVPVVRVGPLVDPPAPWGAEF